MFWEGNWYDVIDHSTVSVDTIAMTDLDKNNWFLIPSINFSIFFKYFCTTLNKTFLFVNLQINCFPNLMYSNVGFKRGVILRVAVIKMFRGKRFILVLIFNLCIFQYSVWMPRSTLGKYPLPLPRSYKGKMLAVLQILALSSIWSLTSVLQNGQHDYKQQLLHFVHRKKQIQLNFGVKKLVCNLLFEEGSAGKC